MNRNSERGIINHLSKRKLRDQVKEYIYNEIKRGDLKARDKVPTERELSIKLGVSRKTIENAMKELELENIIFRRVGKGSFVLAKKEYIGKLFSQDGDIMLFVPNLINPLFSFLAERVEKELLKYKKIMIIARSEALSMERMKYLSILKKRGANGIIGLSLPEIFYRFAKSNAIPFVNISTRQSLVPPQITIDLEKAGRIIAGYLIRTGHRKIVCAGCFPYRNEEDMDLRFKAILRYMEEKGLYTKDIVLPQKGRITLDMDYEKTGAELIEKILKRKELPTAIIFYNDVRAFGGIKALLEKGYRIPEDFSIIGFDNVPMAKLFNPSLTTISFDFKFAAKEAVEMVLEGKSGRNITLEPQLIERSSTRGVEENNWMKLISKREKEDCY
jgi:DNA-binding LacI/PurR family transcriptional regulator